MITDEQAGDMMLRLSYLRKKAVRTKDEEDTRKYKQYESECLSTLKYFVQLKTGRYRNFSNYDDLNQEGMEALLKAMKTFKNGKGSFFFWAGLFVNTRIVRSANNHTVIRYPMHVAKAIKPHKESTIPVMVDTDASPEEACEEVECRQVIQQAIERLSDSEREVVRMYYGFEEERPVSITGICKRKKMTRNSCLRTLQSAMETLKDEIEL